MSIYQKKLQKRLNFEVTGKSHHDLGALIMY